MSATHASCSRWASTDAVRWTLTAVALAWVWSAGGPVEVQAQPRRAPEAKEGVAVRSALGLETTYVFRGAPQYTNEEIPSLQAGAEVDYLLSRDASFFGTLWAATALNERDGNAALGTTNEIQLSAGYGRWIQRNKLLRVGGIVYLRPERSPVDAREEVFGQLHWIVLDDQDWRIVPRATLYGEVYRTLGVFGSVGITAERALGNGFALVGDVAGGVSTYVRETTDDFNAVVSSLELKATFLRDWSASGHFSLAFTTDVTEVDSDFIEEHGVFWSGLKVAYTPSFENTRKAKR